MGFFYRLLAENKSFNNKHESSGSAPLTPEKHNFLNS